MDDFIVGPQIEEIIPEEYEDWLRFCAGAYEANEEEAHDDYDEDGWYEFEPGRVGWDEAAANP